MLIVRMLPRRRYIGDECRKEINIVLNL